MFEEVYKEITSLILIGAIPLGAFIGSWLFCTTFFDPKSSTFLYFITIITFLAITYAMTLVIERMWKLWKRIRKNR